MMLGWEGVWAKTAPVVEIRARPTIGTSAGLVLARMDVKLAADQRWSDRVRPRWEETILEDYPELETDDIRACTACAHAVIARDTLSAVSVAE